MLIESPAPGYEIPQGLGDTPQSVQQACSTLELTTGTWALDPACAAALQTKLACNPPSWCNYIPGADYIPACQTCTIQESAASDIGPAMTPANTQALMTEAQTTLQQSCADDPAGCAAYQTASSSPDCAATFGTGAVGQFICGNGSNSIFGLSPGIALIGVGVLALILLKK